MTLVRVNHNNWMPFRNSELDSSTYQPATNLVEANDHFRIEMFVPGFDKKDIKVQVENMMITVSAEIDQNLEKSEERMMRQEFNKGSFNRSFRLSHWVDSENIAAKYDLGILTIRIPKKESAMTKPGRDIEIA